MPEQSQHHAVSVIVAAFDMARWELLTRAVRSAQRQLDDVQVVLSVDNNGALFDRARSELDGVDVVRNDGTRGASTTRNTGARAASGEVLAFLDDDAEARPGWLDGLTLPLGTDPTVVGVGGTVIPSWPAEQPQWFPMEFGWVVGASYTGLPTVAGPVRNVWSENMAVRAADFHRVGGFREGFGKVGNSSRPEDTEFCVRISAAHPGSRWWFQPSAEIVHHVPPHRASPRFFVRRCYSEGRGKAALAALVGRAEGLSSERAHLLSTLPAGVARELRGAARGELDGLLRAAAIVGGAAAAAAGYAHEAAARRAHRSGRHPSPPA